MPLPASLAVPLLFQGGLGAFQSIKGAVDASGNKRPDYSIPQEVLDAVASIKRQADQKYMPGEQTTRALQRENTAGALSQILSSVSDAGDVSQALTSVLGQQYRADNELGVKRAEYLDSLSEVERQYLMQLGQYKDKAFETNELKPFYEDAQAASALQGAGIQNLMGMLNTYAGVQMMGGYDGGNPNGGGVRSGSVYSSGGDQSQVSSPKSILSASDSDYGFDMMPTGNEQKDERYQMPDFYSMFESFLGPLNFSK